MAWGHLRCAWDEGDAAAGASCCRLSSSLCASTFQRKIRQEEEKQQLCSLWDQLKTALHLAQKEVKSDPCVGKPGGACRGMAAAYVAAGFLVSSGGEQARGSPMRTCSWLPVV